MRCSRVVVVHRRQLPIVGPCEGFDPAPGSERGDGGFCERCQHQVHDVSSMTEGGLRSLMAAHEGRRVCLAYRVDARGYVRMRPEPRTVLPSMMLGALAVLLAACAGYLPEADSPGWTCRDPDGYEVVCTDFRDRGLDTVPDAIDEDGEGCPVRPTAEVFEPDPLQDPDDPSPADGEHDGEVVLEPDVDVDPDAPGTSAKFRANFSIDPDNEHRTTIGIVVGWSSTDPRTGRLRYVPTATLWNDWRERRAERRAARARRHLVRR